MRRSSHLLLAITAVAFMQTISLATPKATPVKGKIVVPTKPGFQKKTLPNQTTSESIEPIPALPTKEAQHPKKPAKTNMQNRLDKLFENSNGVF